MEGKCTFYTKNVQEGVDPFINLQFIVWNSTILYYQSQGLRVEDLVRYLGWENFKGFEKNKEVEDKSRRVHKDKVTRSQFIGDKWGMDVHLSGNLGLTSLCYGLTSTSN